MSYKWGFVPAKNDRRRNDNNDYGDRNRNRNHDRDRNGDRDYNRK
jgi:hypothetical protein